MDVVIAAIINPFWNAAWGNRYRWVEKDSVTPDFGQVWYNPESDLIFVRQVVHEFQDKDAQIIEDNRSCRGCILLGDL